MFYFLNKGQPSIQSQQPTERSEALRLFRGSEITHLCTSVILQDFLTNLVLLLVLKLSGIRPGQEQSPFTAEELGALRPVMTK